MPLSPYFLYETTLHAPDMPPEPALAIGPHVEQDGGLAFLALTARYGPFPQTLPRGTLAETPFGFLWTIAAAPVVFQLTTRQRFDDYWRASLPGSFPPFATNEDLWRWFSERYGWDWPDAPPSAPPGAIHIPTPPGAPVPPPAPAAPEQPAAPPLPAWIELSLGSVPPADTGDVSRIAPLADFPPGLTVRWNGDRAMLFAQATAALGHVIAALDGGDLPPAMPPLSPQPAPGAAPIWFSARMGARGHPDATTQFATIPVAGFDPGLVLAWPASLDGLSLFSRLANALQAMDGEMRAEEPSAPPVPPSLTTATDAWADLIRRHHQEEDAALIAALSVHGDTGPDGADRLRTLGVQIARVGQPQTDRALVAWLQSAPDDTRLTVVAPVLHAAWGAESGPLPVSADAVAGLIQAAAVAITPETRAAAIAALETAAQSAAADTATRERASAAVDSLRRAVAEPSPPAPPPPGSHPSGAIHIRQLPTSEDTGAGAETPAPPAAPPPPPVAPPTLILVVEDGDAAGRRVPLVGRVVVGRHAACDFALPDMEVSRNHAVIERDDAGQTTIRDTNSANGVFVNGARVATHLLHADDRLTLGQTRLRIIPEGD